MDPRRTLRGTLMATAIMVLTQACVDPFTGGFVYIDFNSQINESLLDAMTNPQVFGERLGGVTGAAEPQVLAQHSGQAPFASQPPANTHFQLNYVRNATDADGNRVQYSFKAGEFELQPQVDLFDPCVMDIEPTRFPGIHITAVRARTAEEFGFATPTDYATLGPSDPVWDDLTENERAEVFHTARRNNLIFGLSGRLLSVTSYHPTSPITDVGVDTVCASDPNSDPGLIPPHLDVTQLPNIVPTCFDDESNARRRSLCETYFADNPNYYVGSDRILTKPLNGVFDGTVYSLDPRNPLGVTRFIGALIITDSDVGDIDGMSITWQYDDDDGDGEPDYPASVPDSEKSPTGHTYLSGSPSSGLQQRGVTTLTLTSQEFLDPFLNADVTIYDNLDEDNVNF